MSTIDAAIIKALVEHVGGDSSGIPDGTIGGGTTYTAGAGIEISDENVISVSDQKITTNIIETTIIKPWTSSVSINGDVTIPQGRRFSLGTITDLEQAITELQQKVNELERQVNT